MQSPLVIVLRTSLLLGVLGFLPLYAAGGLAAPGEAYTAASAWLARNYGTEPLTAPRMIQVELPAEALCYREPTSSPDTAWEEMSADDLRAELKPVAYEEIQPPADRDMTGKTGSPRTPSWAAMSPVGLPTQGPHQENNPAAASNRYSAESVASPAGTSTAEVEARLRELGASEVRLEPWGSRGQLYRYCAVLPVAGSSDIQRHFQTIGDDPARAAFEVLSQVEAWRGR
jgi:hypothetical protein